MVRMPGNYLHPYSCLASLPSSHATLCTHIVACILTIFPYYSLHPYSCLASLPSSHATLCTHIVADLFDCMHHCNPIPTLAELEPPLNIQSSFSVPSYIRSRLFAIIGRSKSLYRGPPFSHACERTQIRERSSLFLHIFLSLR